MEKDALYPFLPHIAARLFDVPLAIEPRKLDTIVAILSPRLGIIGIEAETPADMTPKKRRPYQVANGTAIIPIMGTLVQRSSGLDALSGLTSYTQLSSEFDQALNDPDVRQILLHIDSPGGEATGLFDFTDQIFAAHGQKPIVALGDGMAASAAYAIGAAAEKFYLTQGSIAGSIGVRMKHVDVSRANEADGFVVTDIYAGSHKIDGSPDAPLTDSAREALQQIVNDSYDLFTGKVANYRNVTQGQVKATEANVYVGDKAQPWGLVDGVRTLSQLLGEEPAIQGGSVMDPITTAAGLASAYPELVAQIKNEAFGLGKKESTATDCETAVKAEQERVKEILGLAGYALPKLVEESLFVNGGVSADRFARLALEKKYEKTGAAAAAFLADADEAKPAKVAVSPDPQVSPEQAKVNQMLGVTTEAFLKYQQPPQQ